MESDKNTKKNITYKRATRLALSQQVITRLQWTDKQVWQTRNINNKTDPQKKHCLGTVSKIILLEGFNYFFGTNLTPISDVDQEN